MPRREEKAPLNSVVEVDAEDESSVSGSSMSNSRWCFWSSIQSSGSSEKDGLRGEEEAAVEAVEVGDGMEGGMYGIVGVV